MTTTLNPVLRGELLQSLVSAATDFVDDLDRADAPLGKLRDLLVREFELDLSTAASRLRLDSVVEEITRVVLDPYVEDACYFCEFACDLLGREERPAA